MNTDLTLARSELYASMDAGQPIATYKKTILGKVAVTVWDNFTEKPVDVILQGNPKNNDASSIVNIFSEKENAFFKRANARHFSKGLIIPFSAPKVEVIPDAIEQASDEQLEEIVNLKWYALINKLNEIESPVVLYRLKSIAEDNEKSVKVIGAIEKRVSEIQSPVAPQSEVETEE